jgi:hypothetical protein
MRRRPTAIKAIRFHQRTPTSGRTATGDAGYVVGKQSAEPVNELRLFALQTATNDHPAHYPNRSPEMALNFLPLPTAHPANRVPRSLATIPIAFVVDNTAVATVIALDAEDRTDLTRDDVAQLVTSALHQHGVRALNRPRPADFGDRLARAADQVRRLFPDLDDNVLDLFVEFEGR